MDAITQKNHFWDLEKLEIVMVFRYLHLDHKKGLQLPQYPSCSKTSYLSRLCLQMLPIAAKIIFLWKKNRLYMSLYINNIVIFYFQLIYKMYHYYKNYCMHLESITFFILIIWLCNKSVTFKFVFLENIQHIMKQKYF